MEVTERYVFSLDETSQPGAARRTASAMASRLGCAEEDSGRIAIIVTEMATNVVKHGQGGRLLLVGTRNDDTWRVGVLALDRGPGMRDVAACLEDGMSTGGTPGNGLGAIRRLATTFDIHSSPAGTALFAEVTAADAAKTRRSSGFEVGSVRIPHPGEEVCGDDVAVVQLGGERCMVLVADGLGHGAGANEAAEEATRLFRERPGDRPGAVLAMLHDGLRGTRGAAAAVAELDARRRTVRFAGVGNVAAFVLGDEKSQGMVSHHGTLGHQITRIHEFTYPWPAGSLVILHSDGISSRWDLGAYPGLVRRHAMLVASVLYRDFARRSDDASVVVVREAA